MVQNVPFAPPIEPHFPDPPEPEPRVDERPPPPPPPPDPPPAPPAGEPPPVLELDPEPEPDHEPEPEPDHEPEPEPEPEPEQEGPVFEQPVSQRLADLPPPPDLAAPPSTDWSSLPPPPGPPAPPGGWIPVPLPPARVRAAAHHRGPISPPPALPAPFDQDGDGVVDDPAIRLEDLPPPPGLTQHPSPPSYQPPPAWIPEQATAPSSPSPLPQSPREVVPPSAAPLIGGPGLRPYGGPLRGLPPNQVPPITRRRAPERNGRSPLGCSTGMIAVVVVALLAVAGYASLGSRSRSDSSSFPTTTLDVSQLDSILDDVPTGVPAPDASFEAAAWSSSPDRADVLVEQGDLRVGEVVERDGRFERGPLSPPVDAAATAARPEDALLGSADGMVAIGKDGGVALVDAGAGTLGWSVELPGDVAAAVFSEEELVVHTEQGTTFGVDLDDGVRRWARDDQESSVLHDVAGRAVIARYGDDGTPAYDLLDPSTGDAVHTSEVECPEGFSLFDPMTPLRSLGGTEVLVADAIAPDQPACALRLDLASGAVRWSTALSGLDYDAPLYPAFDERWFVMPAADGSMLLLDAETGATRPLGVADGNRRYPLGMTGGQIVVVAGPAEPKEGDLAEVWDPSSGQRRWFRFLPENAAVEIGLTRRVSGPERPMGAISWSDTEVFLFGHIGSEPGADDDERVPVLRVALDGTVVGDGPVVLDGMGGIAFSYDTTHPKDGRILGVTPHGTMFVIAPAEDDPVQKIEP